MKAPLYSNFRSLILILLLLLPFLMNGQQESDSVHYSPYTVIYNHLFYLQPETFDSDQSALSFPGTTIEANQELAVQLKQILDGRGLYVDINQVPDKYTLDDSLSRQIYTLFNSEPNIYVERSNKGWHYSRTTIDNIPKMHREVYPLGTNLMKRLATPRWEKQFLGIRTWQWMGLLIMLVVTIIIHRLLTLIFRFIIPRLARKRFIDTEAEVLSVKKVARTFSLFMVTRALILFIPTLLLSPKAAFFLMRGLHILNGVFIILFLLNLVDLFMIYLTKLAERTKNTMDDQLVPVARRITKGVVLFGGIIYILNILDVNITALLTGISIGGLALALAAQDTVKNLIGSLVIFVDRPFQIGDWINFDGIDGTVEEVGIRSTRVRTFANSVIYVPNGKLADMTVNNMGVRLFRRYSTQLGITYDTPPHLIEAFVEGIKEMIRQHPSTRKDYFEVHLNGFGDSSLNIMLYMFFRVPDWTNELSGKHDIIIGIIKLADKLGIRFAFPTTTLHIEEFPGTSSLTPSHDADTHNADNKVREFIQEFKQNLSAPTKQNNKHGGEDAG